MRGLRESHVGILNISVRKEYRGIGLGKIFDERGFKFGKKKTKTKAKNYKTQCFFNEQKLLRIFIKNLDLKLLLKYQNKSNIKEN
jgi:hypothetical protein